MAAKLHTPCAKQWHKKKYYPVISDSLPVYVRSFFCSKTYHKTQIYLLFLLIG